MKDNFNWFLIEEYGKEPRKISGKIKMKDEQVAINIFAVINNKNKNRIVNGFICRSIFTNYEVIILDVKLFYYKTNKINLVSIKSDLEREIKRIKELNEGYKNLNTYIQIDNTIILYPQSYDLFLQNLLAKQIITNTQVPEEYHNMIDFSLKRNKTEIRPQQSENMREVINDREEINNNVKTSIDKTKNKVENNEGENNEKIYNNKILNNKTFVEENANEKKIIVNNQNIQDIQNNVNDNAQVNQLKDELEKEKLKNKNLSEKIKILENKITEENNKNNNLEIKIGELNTELNLLKEKYNRLKSMQGADGQVQMENTGMRDSFYETVLDKDREIKELKSKLARYPFILNDGEKLLSVIFTSNDQVIHRSVICKNNELFVNVENRLYDDGYTQYKDSETFFTFNGLKINKNKTLEENNIKNSDVIILNVIDDDD